MLQGLNQRSKTKVPVVGTGSLNLAEFASVIDQKDFDLSIPLTLPGGSSVEPSLSLTVCSQQLSIYSFVLTYFSLSFYATNLHRNGFSCDSKLTLNKPSI